MDEPLLRRAQDESAREPALPQRIRTLLEGQPYGVLCTQGGGQPYGSLVAFAFTENLAALFFGTPKTTRKFHLLSACEHVAMLIDTRAADSTELTRVEALTVTGRAEILGRGLDYERCLHRLSERHPHLRSFFLAPTTALVSIDVIRYFHVSRFQDVREWAPTRDG